VTLEDVRAAAIDRAIVDDDPEPALALAGIVDGVEHSSTRNRTQSGDSVMQGTTGNRTQSGDDTIRELADDRFRGVDPLVATMLAMGAVATDRSLDDGAWRPGTDPDPLVVAGAAAAVRTRTIAIDRAAELAGCASSRLEAIVKRQRRHEEKA
jgi:hypothetical protein